MITPEQNLMLELLNHLPDSVEQTGTDWAECWDALTMESQDKVVDIREKVIKYLESQSLIFEEEVEKPNGEPNEML